MDCDVLFSPVIFFASPVYSVYFGSVVDLGTYFHDDPGEIGSVTGVKDRLRV